ncbi:olfactomedin-4-like [Aplochiton taeniatus]
MQDASQVQRVVGEQLSDSCLCPVNSSVWSFPALKYDSVLQLVQTCDSSLNNLVEKVRESSELLPEIYELVQNLTARLQRYQYLSDRGVYTALHLRQLAQELGALEQDIHSLHADRQSPKTQALRQEVSKLRQHVERMHMSDSINVKAVKEKLRYLKNGVQSCKTIPKDFHSAGSTGCYRGLMTNISKPVVTKISPFGKSYISGSWGHQTQRESPVESDSYWVQPLVSGNTDGNTVRLYSTYDDFMASSNHRDVTIAPSHSHANTVQGPSMVLHGGAVYYHCYRAPEVCRFDLGTKAVARVALPGVGVGAKNQFPYCYYDCRPFSDVDLEADEAGVWAVYATLGNHGNAVLSRLSWDAETGALNVTHTWETRLFKKAVSNAFVACGVLYATRYVDEFRDEVFYAFDMATGNEDSSLALPLEKVAKGLASLSYNPVDRQLYTYNDGYLLAYQTS